MKIDEFDAIECNEAFAAIALMWQKEFGYPMERFNPRGGAIAIGHPLGACGVALMTRLLRHLEAHRRPLRLPDDVRRRRPSQRHRHRTRCTASLGPESGAQGARSWSNERKRHNLRLIAPSRKASCGWDVLPRHGKDAPPRRGKR